MKMLKNIFNNYRAAKLDPFYKFGLGITLVSFILTLALLIYSWNSLPPQLPLFYSMPWGEEQLGNPKALLRVSGLFLGLAMINMLISILLFSEHKYFARILLSSAALIAILGNTTLIKIILLIT